MKNKHCSAFCSALLLTVLSAPPAQAGGTRGSLDATTTTLTATPNPAKVGSQVRITATVTTASGEVPEGTVTFVSQTSGTFGQDNQPPRILGTAPLRGNGATRSVSITLKTTYSGMYHLGANYSGSTASARSASEVLPITYYKLNEDPPRSAPPVRNNNKFPLDIVRME